MLRSQEKNLHNNTTKFTPMKEPVLRIVKGFLLLLNS